MTKRYTALVDVHSQTLETHERVWRWPTVPAYLPMTPRLPLAPHAGCDTAPGRRTCSTNDARRRSAIANPFPWLDDGQKQVARCHQRILSHMVRPNHTGQAPLRRLEISFSQGAGWKALISKYIGTIPLSGDAFEHNASGDPPPRTAVSSAMIAKVGAAAR